MSSGCKKISSEFFSVNAYNFFVYLSSLPENFRYLEIGSFEGGSAIFVANRFKNSKDVYYQWLAVTHSNVPEYENAVRLIHAAGEWALHYISDDSTEVSYSWNGELRGDFPSFSLNSAWNKAGTEIINELRHAIENSSK